MADADLVVNFPEYFDQAESEITAKGFFADLVVEANGKQYRPVFYDPVRFGQEARDRLAGGDPCYVEIDLVIVTLVDRSHIQDAVAWLARHGFAGMRAL